MIIIFSNFLKDCIYSRSTFTLESRQKSSQNKMGLNYVTAAPFMVFYFAADSWEKDTKTGQLWRN